MQLMLNFMRKNCKILFAIFQPRAICAPGGFRNSRYQTFFFDRIATGQRLLSICDCNS